jgi:hypothetical protein
VLGVRLIIYGRILIVLKTSKSIRKKKPKTPTKRSELRSGYEFKVLKSLKEQGVSFEYETEKIGYTVPVQNKKYIPDFIITTKSGKKIYIEAKGRWVANDRKKLELVMQQNPDKDVRILFMRDNPIRKGSKTKYSDWCRKKGFTFAISTNGSVPEEWTSE